MRKILLAVFCCSLLNAGCKKSSPSPVANQPTSYTKPVDTTYVISPVPATSAHNVLIEEFSGQSCANSPAANSLLDEIAAANPKGAINIIGMYLYGIPQSVPPAGSLNNLRDSVATSISADVFDGVNSLPIAGIDRVLVSGTMQIAPGLWDSTAASQLKVVDYLNLQAQSSYNSATNVATITVTVTYTQPVSTPQNISVVIVEDSITDFQAYPAFNTAYPRGIDTFYVFTNVFRGMVSSSPFGDLVNTPSMQKEAGRVYMRTYTYTPKTLAAPDKPINPKHCKAIAFVSSTNGSDFHVVQSVQTPLVP